MVMTFIPFGADFKATAQCLDRPRLGKQRLETKMIMSTLIGLTNSWSNHPVMHMWRGNLNWLYEYNCAIYDEYAARGYNDHTRSEFELMFEAVADNPLFVNIKIPYWLDSSNTHYTHRGNLYRKNPTYYANFSIYSDYRRYVCCPDRGCNTLWPGHLESRLAEDSNYLDIFKIAPTEAEVNERRST